MCFMEKQIHRLAPPGGRDKPIRNSANLILHQFEVNLLSEEAKLLDKELVTWSSQVNLIKLMAHSVKAYWFIN